MRPIRRVDRTAPTIDEFTPAGGETVGSSASFTALVEDDSSGVDSVQFVIAYNGGTQTFEAAHVGSDIWQVDVSGLPDGDGTWTVIATDNGRRGGNTATSDPQSFTVDAQFDGGGDEGGGDEGGATNVPVVNERWTSGGDVQSAAGRLMFEMPSEPSRTNWTAYVCSGTAAVDGTTGRSIILTAAHCVYDDVNKAFARNVLFIPNQDQTSGSGSDRNCDNDPAGCWVPSFGVVDPDYSNRVWPTNIPWDYGYYVVEDSGAHMGTSATSEVLDEAVPALDVSFEAPILDTVDGSAFTYAFGYSYANDPFFMYCSGDLRVESDSGSGTSLRISGCGISPGASGGPWIQDFDPQTGRGSINSVDSHTYWLSPTDGSGNGGPKLYGNSAECLFGEAKSTLFNAVLQQDGEEGITVGTC